MQLLVCVCQGLWSYHSRLRKGKVRGTGEAREREFLGGRGRGEMKERQVWWLKSVVTSFPSPFLLAFPCLGPVLAK